MAKSLNVEPGYRIAFSRRETHKTSEIPAMIYPPIWQLLEVVPRRADCRSTRLNRPRLQNASLARRWLCAYCRSPLSHLAHLGPLSMASFGLRPANWRLSSSVFSKLFVPRETNLPPNMLLYWRLEEFPVMLKSWTCLDHPSMLVGVAYLGNMIYGSGAGNRTLFLSVALR